MLPAAHRLTDASSYRRALRRGRRASSRTLVVSVLTDRGAEVDAGASTSARPSRLGLVVAKTVGVAVVRNRVKRRLRHLVAERLPRWPTGTDVVLRALPAAGAASSAELARDLDRCLDRCLNQGARVAT